MVYSSNEIYPRTQIKIIGYGDMNGYRIAHVEIFPVRYTPAEMLLRLTTQITYRLEYTESASPPTIPTDAQRTVFGNAVRSLVVNPEDVFSFTPKISARYTPTALPSGNFQYVIISESPLDTVFDKLTAWKTRKGIPATIVEVSWIETNYAGCDTPERIRNFIKDARDTWGTIYVLLGGSADYKTTGQNIVPARGAYYMTSGVWAYPDEDTIPSDLYYSDLDRNWNDNGNTIFGELTDNVDMYSDVYIGRAPVYNVTQAQNFVYKVLKYEKDPPVEHIRKLMLPTAILWDSYNERPMQDSIAHAPPPGWTVAKMYQRTGALSRSMMIDSMNVGYNLGHWEGHGDEEGMYMSSSPYLNSSDADGLTNGDKIGIANSIACFTGAWDETPGGDCFAEHLVNRIGGGLVATMMNSRFGWGAYIGYYVPGPSERIDTTFYHLLFSDPMFRIGSVHAASKDAWVPYAYSTDEYDYTRWCIYELNLLGDPEMPIWTDIPESLEVFHDDVIPIGATDFALEVASGGTPLENALCCLMKDGEVYETAFTDASGNVNIMLSSPPISPGSLLVTVTAHNKYPYESSIIVIAPSGPYVIYRNYIIDDDTLGESAGNCDGLIDAGEIIELPLWIRNYGSDTAYVIVCKLSTDNPFVTILDSLDSFDFVAPDDSLQTAAYLFQVGTDYPNANAIYFELIIEDSMDSVWSSWFVVRTAIYEMNLLPDIQSKAGFAGDTTWFEFFIENNGTSPVSYDLSVAGNRWITTIWDSAATSVISNTGVIPASESVMLLASVEVPDTASKGEIDSARVTATSTVYSSVSDTSAIRTTAYVIYSVPFDDGFESGLRKWNLSGTGNWDIYTGVGYYGTGGTYEGDSAMVMTCRSSGIFSESYADLYLKLADETDVVLDFYWRAYSLLSASERICLDIYDGTWHNGVDSLSGDDTEWQNVHLNLGAYDMINGFIVRFRARMDYTESSDAAYVDNVALYIPNLPPEISHFPDTSVIEDNILLLYLDNYVFDLDNHDSTLIWNYNIYEDIYARFAAENEYTQNKWMETNSFAENSTSEFFYDILDCPVHVDIDEITHIATITTDENWNGSRNIVLIVTDTYGLFDSDTFAFSTIPDNDAPEIVDFTPANPGTVAVEASIVLWVGVHDIDSDIFTFDWYINSALDTTTEHPFFLYSSPVIRKDTILVSVSDGEYENSLGWIIYVVVGGVDEHKHPAVHSILNIYPNPFNSGTEIGYEISCSEGKSISGMHSHVRLEIQDVSGRHIATLFDGRKPPGRYSIRWDGTESSGENAPTGVYIVVIKIDNTASSARAVLLR